MKTTSTIIIPLLAIAAQTTVAEAKESKGKKLPNIIIINLDDAGYGDFSYNGATGYTTPNIDRMAAEGMIFTHFLAGGAVSAPSRASLMTGCYPQNTGLSGNPVPKSTMGVDTDVMTMAELLKQSGYTTAVYGKWHLGHQTEHLPLQRGFDEFYGLPYSSDMWPHHPDNDRYKFPDLPTIEGNETVEYNVDPATLTISYTERTIEFIERNKRSPFFIYLAHPMPHTPLAASPRFEGKSEIGLYGDVMMEIDWSVEQILAALKKLKLEENTLVVLTSDNGPALMYGEHAGSAGGLREGKGTRFEGGQRVPCVMYWKGVIEAGSVCNKLASNIDLFPTAAEMAGAPLPERAIDGVSILSLIEGDEGANPRESFIYGTGIAYSDGLYKLILPHTYKSTLTNTPGKDGIPGGRETRKVTEPELYDLRRDPGERYNIIAQHPEIVEKLMKLAR